MKCRSSCGLLLTAAMSISLVAVIALCVVASILIIGAVYIKWYVYFI